MISSALDYAQLSILGVFHIDPGISTKRRVRASGLEPWGVVTVLGVDPVLLIPHALPH